MTDFKTLRLSAPAQNDLSTIAEYTQRQWDVDQKRVYLNILKEKFHRLCENPNLGTARDDIAKDLRLFNAGKQLIFYRNDAETLEVVRVLHVNMDVQRLKLE